MPSYDHTIDDFTPLTCKNGNGSVRIECLDENGRLKLIEAAGWYARILQHEIDHLEGHLYIDRMRIRTFTSLDNMNRFWKGKAITEVRSILR